MKKHFNISDEINDISRKSEKALEDNAPDKAMDYAIQCAKKLNETIKTYYPEILIEFETKELISETWNRVNIMVENEYCESQHGSKIPDPYKNHIVHQDILYFLQHNA